MKKIILALVTMLIVHHAGAQTQTFSNIKRIRANNVDAIIENKQVIGYYMFSFLEKASSKESVYQLEILDANLNKTHSIELNKPKNSFLLEGSFNGNVFCFSFLNQKQKSLEYQIIDKNAKIVGSYMVTDVSNSEMQQYAASIQNEDEDTYSGGLMAIEGKGFVRYGIEKEGGFRYEIEMIDNNAKKVWTANSGVTTKKSFESAQSFYSDKNSIVTLVTTRPKQLSAKDTEYYLLFSNTTDGKDMFKYSTEHEKGYLVPMGINYDDSKQGYIVYGEYYGKTGKERFDPENKIGFFLVMLDNKGKVIEEGFVDWKTDITKLIPVNEKGRMEGNLSVFIHNLVKTADGKYYVIGEQFKKAANGLAIAANVLSRGGSSASNIAVELHDMIVFEFNSDFKPEKVYIVEKDPTKVTLPKGAGLLTMNTLGTYLKQNGWFDYSFTYTSSDNKIFNSTFVNYDKEKGEKNKYVIGNIVYKNGEIKTDRIPLTSKPTFFGVMPGKPGYIVIYEYFRKKKELIVRLEKLDV